jgi:hypothetical protein
VLRSRPRLHASRRFTVAGHHYALVHCSGLEPGTVTPYEVSLDGGAVLAARGLRLPPSVIRTPAPGGPVTISSARAASPRRTRSRTRCARTRTRAAARSTRSGPGALMRRTRRRTGRTLLILLGDQVYADEVSPGTSRVDPARAGTSASRPTRRSRTSRSTRSSTRSPGRPTIPLAALDRLDRDDLRRPRRPRRLEHLGGVGRVHARDGLVGRPHRRRPGVVLDLPAPGQPVADPTWRRSRSTRGAEGGDIADELFDFAFKADREVQGTRWSFCRDLGPASS